MNSNITASLPTTLVKYIDEKAKSELASKSDIIRRAILKMKEDEFYEELILASKDAKEGKTFKGNLDELTAKLD
jgi:Arc/MetJ-type ribon-helix-helix transcriptional regulator